MFARAVTLLATLAHVAAQAAVDEVSPAEARSNLVRFQALIREMSATADASERPCRDAEAALVKADASLVTLDLSDMRSGGTDGVGKTIQAAKAAKQVKTLACDRHIEAERQLRSARGLLRDAMLEFQGCLTFNDKDAKAACGNASRIATQQLQTHAGMNKKEAFAAAKETQATVAKLKASAEQAFKLSDKAVSESMAAYATADGPAQQASLMENATRSHEEALRAHRASDGAQGLSNRFMDDVLALARCDSAVSNCDQLTPERLARARALDAEIKRRAADSEEALTNAKLAAFKVKAESIRDASVEERSAALRFLQLIDSNPDVRSLFGGEAIRFSAGKKGSSAAIRVDFDRIVNNPGKDFSLIVTAPVGNDGSSAIYSSEDGVTSGAKATLAYRFTPRLFKSDRVLDRLFQFGLQASVGYSAHSYRRPDDIGVGIKSHSTPWSIGGQLIYADSQATWIHQVGVDYKSERRFADGVDKTTRCAAVPAGQLSVGCVTAYFDEPRDYKGLEFNYTWRFKLGRIAFAPSLSYESQTRVKTLAVPVYLIGDVEKKVLNAGIGFGHSSSGKDGIKSRSEIRFFVSSPFSLTGE